MEKEEKMVSNFTLPNKTVTVKFIPRKKGMAANVADNHVISGGMLTNAVKTFMCPINQRSGGLVNVLTNDEKKYLEDITGLDLSVYGDFWTTFQVKLYKDDASNVFDLSNPMGYISYKLLLRYPDEISASWKGRNHKSTYMFAITEEGEIGQEKKSKLSTKKEAFKEYGKIEDNREMLVSVLKLLSNRPISSESNLDWLQGQVQEYVDSSPEKFLNIIQDSSFEVKALIHKAVEKGIILKNDNKYTTVDGLDLCANGQVPTFNNAVRYLQNDKNQEVRLLIEARVDK